MDALKTRPATSGTLRQEGRGIQSWKARKKKEEEIKITRLGPRLKRQSARGMNSSTLEKHRWKGGGELGIWGER